MDEELIITESVEPSTVRQPNNRLERHRLIAHLGKTFARRYDIQVIPSRQRGVWATALDPMLDTELNRYIKGDRDTLDDLPPESFVPKQILFDDEGAQNMSMEEILTLLRHEAGHAKYTDFVSMFEGQRRAKDEGYLPTSFWLVFEGIEDPRVNSLEGLESPTINRQIRKNQGQDLQKRISEILLKKRPKMLQFAYNSFHYWLHGEGIPELVDTEVGKVTEMTYPLLQRYFETTDLKEIRLLQREIWDIAKTLEEKDIESEEQRQMAKQQRSQQRRQGESQTGSSSGKGQGSTSENTQPSKELSSDTEENGSESSGQDTRSTSRESMDHDEKQPVSNEKGEIESVNESDEMGSSGQNKDESGVNGDEVDLSKLSEEERQQINDAIDNLSPEERELLRQLARDAVDEVQREALEEDLSKTLKF